MKIHVPHWAEPIKEEGVLTILAFFYRICEIYGYDTWYYLDKADFTKIANKYNPGAQGHLADWLMSYEGTQGNLGFGEPFSNKIMFKLKQRPVQGMKVPTRADKELHNERQIRIWIYILGCLTHNIVEDITDYSFCKMTGHKVAHIPEFNLTNEAVDRINED